MYRSESSAAQHGQTNKQRSKHANKHANQAAINSAKGPGLSVLIIGAGFSGLAAAIKLKAAGFSDITVLEKAAEVGGTWRENNYPGCACDVPSHLYSYSFAPNPNWSRMFAPQEEIFAYLKRCTQQYQIQQHIHCSVEVSTSQYDEKTQRWRVSTTTGRVYEANLLISAVGGLHQPAIPKLPGIERFTGPCFHSAQWRHDVELSGKRVAVIGTGASAIQFVPEIAGQTAQLSVFQRTAAWVLPKPDRAISTAERLLFKRLPRLQQALRQATFLKMEGRALGFAVNPRLMNIAKHEGRQHIRRYIKDPSLRRKLTPNYLPGCKRILISDDYYPALARSNVGLVTESIDSVDEQGITTKDGQHHAADVIIYGTGFNVTNTIAPGQILGRQQQDLAAVWADGMQAYKGTTIHGFPNLFMLLGPNTGLGHNSIISMVEAQVDYLVQAAVWMRDNQVVELEAQARAQLRYNRILQRRLAGSVWSSGCASWYLDEQGKNSTIWPSFITDYQRMMRHFDAKNYHSKAALSSTATAESL